MHDLLRELRCARRHAHVLVTGPDRGGSRPPLFMADGRASSGGWG
jgi:hypothetical protein